MTMGFLWFLFSNYYLTFNYLIFELLMTDTQKRTWKRVLDIIVTILTAIITSLTTTSCIQ